MLSGPQSSRIAVEAGHPGMAGVEAQQGGQDPHGGGLAGAVRAEQPLDAAGWTIRFTSWMRERPPYAWTVPRGESPASRAFAAPE